MLEWDDATVYQGIAAVADRRPDRTALVFDGDRTSYAELIAESQALAHALADVGVSAGDRIAVWLSNRPEWITTQLAASYLGAAVVAVNTRYRTHELAYMVDDSDCKLLLTEETFLGNDHLNMLSEVVPEIRENDPVSFSSEHDGALNHVVALESHPNYPAVRRYEEFVDGGRNDDERPPADDPTVPAAVFYTSGTTSDPKGCLQSNRSLLNHSYNVGTFFDISADDVALGVLPFCGIWGYNMFLSALAHGIPLVVQTHFDAERTIELVESHEVTYMSALATMLLRMVRHDSFDPERVGSMERGATGFITMGYDEAVFEDLEEAFGFPLVQPYGLSEGNSQIFIGDPTDSITQRKKVGGPPIHSDLELRIVNPKTGETLPPGTEGEICLRGYNVMNEYHEKPEKTAENVDDDGWFHTGDLGVRDEQGYFYYKSRLDDALRVRGFLVTPHDIETVIDEHPGVERSQVVGAPHPRHGQVPVAFVKRSETDLEVGDLRTFLEDRVADYKVPEDVEFVDEFPRSEGPHGEKIQKIELRDRVAARYKTD
ncbi:class I adenylate-forming enzyme family protein [Natrinema gelatinilyticum]|uniref:class I adenylate-forming enzyme family protein n=1 Tax=Natrinema gelatinilyticum TaxID=2961571 RepID=UPI0020C3F64D|nr:class I adenylate-forming enzyme family protein [Natrinema gelatinilyticum]